MTIMIHVLLISWIIMNKESAVWGWNYFVILFYQRELIKYISITLQYSCVLFCFFNDVLLLWHGASISWWFDKVNYVHHRTISVMCDKCVQKEQNLIFITKTEISIFCICALSLLLYVVVVFFSQQKGPLCLSLLLSSHFCSSLSLLLNNHVCY